MNAVNHQVVAVTLGLLTWIVCLPRQRSVVAQNAHFNLIAIISVEGEQEMALVAGRSLNHRSPRLYRVPIDWEIEHLVRPPVPHFHFLGGSGQEDLFAAAFDADRETSRGASRYSVFERVDASRPGARPAS